MKKNIETENKRKCNNVQIYAKLLFLVFNQSNSVVNTAMPITIMKPPINRFTTSSSNGIRLPTFS